MENERGLYVHIPFCIKKCRYCDFISFCDKEDRIDEYIESLLAEAKKYRGKKINSVFIGGGTPTVLNSNQLERLIKGLYKTFDIEPECEFSVESNPKTLDENKLKVLKENGVNRISVGVQSFCDSELSQIGRIHNSKEAENTLKLINEYGFSLNIDLMLSLPNQTEQSLKMTLEKAVSFDPCHISCYSLIIEEGTPIADDYKNGIFVYPEDEFDRELYHMTVDFLKNNGYNRYEISNFSKHGFECRHNLKYWNCEEYIGLGVAAHSYYKGKRYNNTENLDEYIKGKNNQERVELSEDDKISEYIIMRLRLSDGINEDDFKNRFGFDFYTAYKPIVDKMTMAELMKCIDGSWILTDKGIDVSNAVMCEFV